jgi:hypothetical protein
LSLSGYSEEKKQTVSFIKILSLALADREADDELKEAALVLGEGQA